MSTKVRTFHSLRNLRFLPLFMIGPACGEAPAPPPVNTGGVGTGGTAGGAGDTSVSGTTAVGGTTGVGGTGGATATGGVSGGAGDTSLGGTTATGGVSGNAGDGSLGGTGLAGGSGGASSSGAGPGGTGPGGGAGGIPPSGGSGGRAGGAGGSPPAGGSGGGGSLMDVAKSLDGQMLLGPCGTDSAKSVCQTAKGGCPAANKSDPALSGVITTDRTITLGGTAGQMYTITLHVQGEVEAKTYNGSMDQNTSAQSPNADGFCIGGSPTTGDFYNVYMIRVGMPARDYFFNSLNPPGVSNHTTYGIDYTAQIKANGGSTLRLLAADSNCSMIKNCGTAPNDGSVCASPITITDMDPKAVAANPTFNFNTPYNGQWVSFVVTNVTSP